MLRKRGHAVTVVDNGRDAVRVSSEEPFDVILMDIQMPKMDGLTATKEIREKAPTPRPKIVALTANAMSGERERCLAAGMDDYLAKPFAARELFSAVEGREHSAGGELGEVPSKGPPVDLEALRESLREADVEDSMPGLIALFIEDGPARVAAIDSAAAAQDATALNAAAHAFGRRQRRCSVRGLQRCWPTSRGRRRVDVSLLIWCRTFDVSLNA